MSKAGSAITQIHRMDELAAKDQWVNRVHPLVKLVVTVGYIAAVVSFSKYDLIGLAGMVIYPLAGFLLAELSFADSLKRLWLVLPLVCFVGVLNPLFDKRPILFAGIWVSGGVLSMCTLILKGVFSVLASYLLIATTSVEKLCYALRLLHIPKPVVTQFLLTYRYIAVLLGEVNRITQAYALRAPNQKGVHFRVWGSLAGQLLLHSVDRAQDVYESMQLRGYSAQYRYLRERTAFRAQDALYGAVWVGLIVLFRLVPVLELVGAFAGGLIA